MPFLIRPATPQDSPAVAAAVREVFDEYGFTWEDGYCADLHHLEEHYLRPGSGFWVAELEGQVVGCCGLSTFPAHPGSVGETVLLQGKVRAAGADCELHRLYLPARFRGQGIGGALLRTAQEAALAHGCRAMEIWSDKKLTLAHELYERKGAVRIGERVCDDPDESPEWGMVWLLGSGPL